MKWFWRILGEYVHVRVFMNGRKCGYLCFSKEEFGKVKDYFDAANASREMHLGDSNWMQFINDNE